MCLLVALGGACQKEADAPKAEASVPKTEAEPAGDKAKPEAAEDEAMPEAAKICRATMKCAAECFRQAGAPAQSLPECDNPKTPECTAALKAARPAPLEATMAGLSCALPCEKEHRSLENLQGVVPEQWAKLSVNERASWTGMVAGRSCVPGASCDEICDGDYPAPETVEKRGKQAAAEAKPAG